MILVGLTGGIGHGKTTFSDYLARRAVSYATYESSDLIIEVANAFRQTHVAHPLPDDHQAINDWLASLPAVLAKHVHKTVEFADISLTEERQQAHPDYYDKLYEYLDLTREQPALQAEPITVANKNQVRALLQWLGGYLAKTVDDGIWYDEITRRLQSAPPVDLVIVGGLRFPADVKRIRSANGRIITVSRPGFGDQDSRDLTERERSDITPDITVINNGSLDDLKRTAHDLYADLVSGHVDPTYSARPLA